jgi:hypothetical protein
MDELERISKEEFMAKLRYYSYIYQEELRKITSNPVTANGFLTESRTVQLPKKVTLSNRSLERYRCTNLLG